VNRHPGDTVLLCAPDGLVCSAILAWGSSQLTHKPTRRLRRRLSTTARETVRRECQDKPNDPGPSTITVLNWPAVLQK
jgi:hypothetical protein